MLEKIPESPLDSKEIKPSILKEINPVYPIKRKTDAEAEAPILWVPNVKTWLVGKDPDVMKH